MSFPMVVDTCPGPGQACYEGKIDISYHGSPEWARCPECGGCGVKARDMTVNEKLDYLLNMIESTE